jgi:hypothetical protein
MGIDLGLKHPLLFPHHPLGSTVLQDLSSTNIVSETPSEVWSSLSSIIQSIPDLSWDVDDELTESINNDIDETVEAPTVLQNEWSQNTSANFDTGPTSLQGRQGLYERIQQHVEVARSRRSGFSVQSAAMHNPTDTLSELIPTFLDPASASMLSLDCLNRVMEEIENHPDHEPDFWKIQVEIEDAIALERQRRGIQAWENRSSFGWSI